MIGKMLTHYEITSLIGRGGMGEVYQAKDRRLGRDVAVKVLPEEFARDADRVARFQREAKLLASLNHPNIASIHGLEESDGTNFLIMELVEGETLADRLKVGRIPAEESLKLALQIAEALEAAHEKGVIHRDLKPANIKVTPKGKVKVLDFGLAKAFAGDQDSLDLSNSPTLSYAATLQGVILGTAAYMSPEQARGKPVDKRADIWAFGCVLYEMLTGRAAFRGEDVTDILAAVVKLDPDLKLLPSNIHTGVRETVAWCLNKDPKNRYRDIWDVKLELEKVLSDPGGLLAKPDAAADPRKKLKARLTWIAVVILAAAASGLLVWNFRTPVPPSAVRFQYELPEGLQFSSTVDPVLAVSPSGENIAFSTTEGLYLRSLKETDSGLIKGTAKDSIEYPFFSPDGRWIGYWSGSDFELKKIAVDGGIPEVLCKTGTSFGGASWNSGDTIVFSDLAGGGVMRISAGGGTPGYLVKKTGAYLYPQLLPDGKTLLFTKVSTGQNAVTAQIMVQPPDSEEPRELFAGYAARYLPTGHIVYIAGEDTQGIRGRLYAVPFDPDSLKVTGTQVPLIEDFTGPLTVSDTGTLVYRDAETMGPATGRSLVWVDRKGKDELLSAPPKLYSNPKISPDGTGVVLNIQETGRGTNIGIWDLVHGTWTGLTFEGSYNLAPLWTPDSKRIAYFSFSSQGIVSKATDGTGKESFLGSLHQYGKYIFPSCWSRDGKNLIVIESIGWVPNQLDIGMLSMEGEQDHKPLMEQDYLETQPKISPDGHWIAYTSEKSGTNDIYIRSFPDVDKGVWQISTEGGDSPLWSPNGGELFFRNRDAVMSVSVKTGPSFSIVGTPRILFRGMYVGFKNNDAGSPWDISSDGKRFLMIKPPGTVGEGSVEGDAGKINVVLNWFEELRQKAPLP
ncbi:MAG: serine/threonine-protein kinase [Acidobacteria bacterium]|nr:serine/threonine-protein kinase [Acidobacteriota bacterium]